MTARIEKTITINAPVEKIFSYVEEPTNLLEYWPSMVEVKDVEPLPNGGRVDKLMLLVEGLPGKATVGFDLIRGARGGFHRRVVLPHQGGEPRGISWADVNGDERLDVLVCCTNGNVLALNEGDTFVSRAAALGISGSSRAAAWADYNADGHPDLVTTNFQVFTSTGGRFRDDSRLIDGRRNPEGGGWIDYDGDGRPDILITNGEFGIRLFRNAGKGPGWWRSPPATTPPRPWPIRCSSIDPAPWEPSPWGSPGSSCPARRSISRSWPGPPTWPSWSGRSMVSTCGGSRPQWRSRCAATPPWPVPTCCGRPVCWARASRRGSSPGAGC